MKENRKPFGQFDMNIEKASPKKIQNIFDTQPSLQNPIISILLDDPALRLISQNIDKEAQENRKKKILKAFSIRFQHLLKIESQYQSKKEFLQVNYTQIGIKNKQIQKLNNNIEKKDYLHHLEVQKLRQQSLHQLKSIQIQRTSLYQQIQNKQKQNSQLKKKLLKLQQEKNKYYDNVIELKSNIKMHQRTINNNERQIQSLKNNNGIFLSTSQVKNQNLKNQIKTLTQTINFLKIQFKSKQNRFLQKMKQKQQQIAKLSQIISQYKIQIQVIKQQKQEQIVINSAQLKKTKEDYLVEKQYLGLIKNQLENAKEQIYHLNLNYETQKKVNEYKSKQIQNNLKIYMDYMQELKNVNKILQEQKQLLQAQNKSLKNKNKEIKEKTIFFQSQNISLNNIINRLKQEKINLEIFLDQNSKKSKKKNTQLSKIKQKMQQQNKQLVQDNQALLKDQQIEELKLNKNNQKMISNDIANEIKQFRDMINKKIIEKQKYFKELRKFILFENIKNDKKLQMNDLDSKCQNIICMKQRQQLKKYQQTIEKMKGDMINLWNNVHQKNGRQKQLFQQVLKQNRVLKSKLQK